MKTDKTELNEKLDQAVTQLNNRIDSVKTWLVTLSISTILVVTALMATFLHMQ